MKLLVLLVLAAACVPLAPSAAAAGDVCTWNILPVIQVDPKPQVKSGTSLTHNGLIPVDVDVPWILGTTPTFGGPVPPTVNMWGWRSHLDADPWIIAARCEAYSYFWGFASVSDSLSGAGQWIITRAKTCCHPKEDIEVIVRQQFHVEGRLDADEKLEIRGALRFWCAKTKSVHNPPKAVHSVAAGGVSIDDDYDDEDQLVEAELGGFTFNLKGSSGGSRADDPQGFDDGYGGTSPERINTSTHVACTMDLDSWDTCAGTIGKVWWFVDVIATCDGCCGRHQVMMHKNDYPNPGK